jgi:glycine/D-amino acid oxidase-like deaminating enzyme
MAGVTMKVGALWPDQLTDAERVALEPGIPDGLDRRPDILVVGGGVIGVATAVACQRAGLGSVLLIEREHLGAGATGGAGGLMMSESRLAIDPPFIVDFQRASLALWWDLEESFPEGVGVSDVTWIKPEPFLPGFLDGLPTHAERLSPEDVHRLAPGLAQPVPAILMHNQAHVNPLQAVARLSAAIPCVATGVEAREVTVAGDRIVAVSTSAGDISPGVVVFALGGPPRLAGLELSVPAGQIKGHIITTDVVPTQLLPGTVGPVGTQFKNGRFMAGGTHDLGDDAPDVRADVVASIWSGLQAAVPAVSASRVTHQWTCFRPTHPDMLPVIDRVPGLANAWITSGHFSSGILNAPATGRAIAEWITEGEQPHAIAGLEISRFG